MKILVCIKQVPSSSAVEIDPATGVLRRETGGGKINPYDLFALEQAFCLREAHGGRVDVLTMGPPQAKSVLLEALYMGADSACLLSDRRFAGADVVATSRTLARGVKKLGGYDLILCGKQTTDGDTAQVGPEMAEWLGIDHACYVQRLQLERQGVLRIEAGYGSYTQIQQIHTPCLLTVEKDVNTPRLPSYLRRLDTKTEQLVCFGLDDFEDSDPEHYGLSGSPTQVERIFPPEKREGQERLTGTPQQLAERFYDLLAQGKYI